MKGLALELTGTINGIDWTGLLPIVRGYTREEAVWASAALAATEGGAGELGWLPLTAPPCMRCRTGADHAMVAAAGCAAAAPAEAGSEAVRRGGCCRVSGPTHGAGSCTAGAAAPESCQWAAPGAAAGADLSFLLDPAHPLPPFDGDWGAQWLQGRQGQQQGQQQLSGRGGGGGGGGGAWRAGPGEVGAEHSPCRACRGHRGRPAA